MTGLNQQLSDASVYANTLTNSGVIVTSISPFTVPTTSTAVTTLGSGLFDGSSGYLTIPNNTNFNLGTTFTIEFWIYRTSTSAQRIISRQDGTSPYYGANINYGEQSGNYIFDASSTKIVVADSNLNTWVHFAWVVNATAGTVYRNGVSVGTATQTAQTPSTNLTQYIGCLDNISNFFNGYLSNLRIVKGAALYTSNFAPSNQSLTVATNTTGTTALLTLQNRQGNNNNIFYDDSPNNFAITRAGTPTQGTFSPFSQNGWSNYFDGSSGYFTNANTISFGTGPYTIEMWIYYSAIPTDYKVLVQGASGAFAIYINPSNYINLWNGASPVYASNISTPLNQWVHIALVRTSTAANGIIAYINGVASTAGTDATNWSSAPYSFGYWPTQPSTRYFGPGYISNIRITSGAAVYTSAFTPPTLALTTATGTTGTVITLTAQSNRFLDNSQYAYATTASGSVQVIPYSPFANQSLVSNSYSTTLVGGSMYFNGSTDYLQLANNTAFDQNGSFTFECWVFPTSTGGYFWAQYLSGYLCFAFSGGKFIVDKSFVGAQITSTGTYTTSSWYHVAASCDGTTTRLFVNGTAQGSAATTGVASGAVTTIGFYSTIYLNGYISNLRFIKGTALYTTAFTPPTTPPSVVAPITTISTSTSTIASTSLLLLGTNGGIIDQTGRNDLISVGTATITASTFKYGAGSIYIPGTGNYLQTTGTRYWIPTGLLTFTIEAWIYMTQLPTGATYPALIGDTIPTSNTMYWGFGPTPTGTLQFYWFSGSTNSVAGNTVMSTSTWNHVAISVNSSTIGLFVNGVNQTLTGTTTLTARAGTLNYLAIGQAYGGGTNGQYYGYIDDLRITQGVARYSTGTNFTLPSVQPVQ